MSRFLAAAVLTLAAAVPVSGANWPSWRGPTNDGKCAETNLPVNWSTTENVRWKVALPAPGNSTPVIWGDRIFLTQATEGGAKRGLMCLSRADGKLLWERFVDYPEKELTHNTNPFCSASPVTDGERVVASFASAGLHCWDMDGKPLWKVELGKLEHIWGTASSPIFHKDLCIILCGPGERQFLLAVEKKTGKEAYRVEIPGGKRGDGGGKDWLGSWCTPVVVTVGDHEELLLPVPGKLKGLDPASGKELWSCGGLGPLFYTSPAVADGVAVAMSGYGGPAMAVKLGGTGDVTATHRLWHHAAQNPQRIGSPIILDGRIHMVSEPGAAQCFNLKTGEKLWQERAGGNTWGSTVLADGKLYVTDQAGTTVVMTAGPEFKVLAKNPLGETVRASIVISDGDLFIRGYKNLWCIREKK